MFVVDRRRTANQVCGFFPGGGAGEFTGIAMRVIERFDNDRQLTSSLRVGLKIDVLHSGTWAPARHLPRAWQGGPFFLVSMPGLRLPEDVILRSCNYRGAGLRSTSATSRIKRCSRSEIAALLASSSGRPAWKRFGSMFSSGSRCRTRRSALLLSDRRRL